MTDSLALIDRARLALSEARTLDEVKDVRDVAIAAKHFAAKRKGAEEAERYANEIRLRAERRLGEITREMEKAPGKRTDQPSPRTGQVATPRKVEALADVGIAKQDASRFEAIASIPPKVFEAEVVKPEASTARLARIGRESELSKPHPVRRVPFNGTVQAGILADHIEAVIASWPEGESLDPLVAELTQATNRVRKMRDAKRASDTSTPPQVTP